MIRYCLELFPSAATVLHAAHPHAGRDRGPVRGDRRDRPGGHEAADRLHVRLPLRLHRARHLRADQPGPVGRDPVHGEPRAGHRGAVPGRGLHDRPPPLAADRGLRRGAEGRAGARRPVPDLRPGRAGPAGPVHVRQRVPGPGRHVHPVQGGRRVCHRGHHPGRDLHPVDVPAHHGRPRPRAGRPDARPEGPGTVGRGAADRADHRLRRVSQAAAGHHQPGGAPDAGADARH